MKHKDVAICILNYNSHLDTIECLESILHNENVEGYTILVMDNGSKEESIKELRIYFEELQQRIGLTMGTCDISNLDSIDLQKFNLILIESRENLGFAVGNNHLGKSALGNDFKYVVFLNNDTTLIMPSVKHLKEFMEHNNKYGVVTSNIVYYDRPSEVWNAGGTIFGGMGRYNRNEHVDRMQKKGKHILPITFVTGCFMMVRSTILVKYGIFTDLFFFGEEDFDFSIRMKKNKVNMCCLLDTEIYHKVGGTKKIVYKDISYLRKSLTGYLNRFINIKQYYSKVQWNSWRIASSIYIFISMVSKRKANIGQALNFVMTLNKLSEYHNRVDKNLYHDILKGKYI